MNYEALKKLEFGGKDIQFGDGSVRFGFGYVDIAQAIRLFHPGGANLIVVAPAHSTGWKSVAGNDGKLSVLIGLLLPAVQVAVSSLTKGADPKLRQNVSIIGVLRAALAPGGELYFVDDVTGNLVRAN